MPTSCGKSFKYRALSGSYRVVNRWVQARREQPGRKHSLRDKHLLGLTEEEVSGTHADHQKPEPSAPQSGEQGGPASAEIALEAPRHPAWLLIRDPAGLDALEQRTLHFLCEDAVGKRLYDLAQRYVQLTRKQDAKALDTWLAEAMTCGIADLASFAQGLQKDYSAVRAAVTLPYSNGPVEGQINRLKFVKRSMYGRGSFELLRQRVLKAS